MGAIHFLVKVGANAHKAPYLSMPLTIYVCKEQEISYEAPKANLNLASQGIVLSKDSNKTEY